MNIKLIAMGNVLMEDDGIAIFIMDMLKEELEKKGVEVVYGETDIGYSLSLIREGDFLILMDAAVLGKEPGEVTLLSFDKISSERINLTQHGISFFDLIKLYYPEIDGILLAIEAAGIGLSFGPSPQLKCKLETISEKILRLITETINTGTYLKRHSGGKNG